MKPQRRAATWILAAVTVLCAAGIGFAAGEATDLAPVRSVSPPPPATIANVAGDHR